MKVGIKDVSDTKTMEGREFDVSVDIHRGINHGSLATGTDEIAQATFSASAKLDHRGTGQDSLNGVVGRRPRRHAPIHYCGFDAVGRQELSSGQSASAFGADDENLLVHWHITKAGLERAEWNIHRIRDSPFGEFVGFAYVEEKW
jgi:hypothetical protein